MNPPSWHFSNERKIEIDQSDQSVWRPSERASRKLRNVYQVRSFYVVHTEFYVKNSRGRSILARLHYSQRKRQKETTLFLGILSAKEISKGYT